MATLKNIAIFASGSGSNAQKIFEHFQNSGKAKINLLLANKADAYALERAKKFNIPTSVFDRKKFYESDDVVNELKNNNTDLIVLAGFLWLIPQNLIAAFPERIINIHPALLPKYGGKGMYGHFVHDAVVKAGDKQSGITIHFVNPHYDEGNIIFQASCEVNAQDTPESVQKKVQVLEHEYYPKVIEKLIDKLY